METRPSTAAQAKLSNQAGVQEFFALREALIAEEKQRRSGMLLFSKIHPGHQLRLSKQTMNSVNPFLPRPSKLARLSLGSGMRKGAVPGRRREIRSSNRRNCFLA